MRQENTAKITRIVALLTITAALNLPLVAQSRSTGTFGSGGRVETSSTQINSVNRGGNLIGSGTRTDNGLTVQLIAEKGSPAIGTGLRAESVTVSQAVNESGILNMMWNWVIDVIL